MDFKFWGLKKVVPSPENELLNNLQNHRKSSEPFFGFKMCSKNSGELFVSEFLGPPTNAPAETRKIRNPKCVKSRDFSTWKTVASGVRVDPIFEFSWAFIAFVDRYQAPRSRSGNRVVVEIFPVGAVFFSNKKNLPKASPGKPMVFISPDQKGPRLFPGGWGCYVRGW